MLSVDTALVNINIECIESYSLSGPSIVSEFMPSKLDI